MLIPILPTLTLTGALTGSVVGPAIDLSANNKLPQALDAECVFTYGSGGTTAKFWLQTSIDGVIWTDIISFAFTTASGVRRSTVHLVSSVTVSQAAALADNTTVSGLLGQFLRVVCTSTGTYAGGTTMAINIITRF